MLRRGWAALAVVGFLFGLMSAPAVAAEDDCEEVPLPDGSFELICDDQGDPGGGNGGGGDGGGSGDQRCQFRGKIVPCQTEYGTWNGSTGYVRVADPQPPKGSSYWEGNDDGVIIEYTPYECADRGVNCDDRSLEWAPNPPAGPQISADELARRAVARMNFAIGSIGSTPPPTSSNGDALGQMGLPIWLWLTNRDVADPITETAADGGLSVQATAALDRTEWLISRNGQALATVTCRGADAPGTPYDGRDAKLPSPTCGFPADFNAHTGNLTLTATAHWTVTWTSSNGQDGTIDVPPQSTETVIRIGETQAILD